MITQTQIEAIIREVMPVECRFSGSATVKEESAAAADKRPSRIQSDNHGSKMDATPYWLLIAAAARFAKHCDDTINEFEKHHGRLPAFDELLIEIHDQGFESVEKAALLAAAVLKLITG